jgi:hypothetical protein
MNPHHPNVGTIGHIDMQPIRQGDPIPRAMQRFAPTADDSRLHALLDLGQLPPPKHWPPRPTRMTLAVRLGITRLLLERRA